MKTISVPDGVAEPVRAKLPLCQGGHHTLSRRELELLSFLAGTPGIPVSRDELLAEVWKMNPACVVTRTIDMHMSSLRRKLRDSPERPTLLTVRGHGYMLAPPLGPRPSLTVA